MIGINSKQFRAYVVNPTLAALGLGGPAPQRLLMLTALQESGLVYLAQLGGGPAVSPFQIEPATAQDILGRYLLQRQDLRQRFTDATEPLGAEPVNWHMVGSDSLRRRLQLDLGFACAVARLKYWMVEELLPDAPDGPGMADYWKRYYNTASGAGSAQECLQHWAEVLASETLD